MIIEAILLGLSTGTYCAMYCGPVLIPFLCGSHTVSYKRNAGLVGTFAAARLVMYFILGAVFGGMGLLVQDFFDPAFARRLSIYAYIFCGLALLANSLGVRFPWNCEKTQGCKVPKLRRLGNDFVTAAFAGLAVGLHICPPLWTAIIRSVFGGNGLPGLFYFLFFYVGTLPYFLPLLGIPFITKRAGIIKQLGKITQFLTAVYFIVFAGLIPFVFGE